MGLMTPEEVNAAMLAAEVRAHTEAEARQTAEAAIALLKEEIAKLRGGA